jgi:alpha-glucoside transport system permease protein
MGLAVAERSTVSPRTQRSQRSRREKYIAWIWAGPAIVIVALFLVYPAISTIVASFQDRYSQNFVGWKNYQLIFTNSNLLEVIRNNILWLILATAGTVFLGLIIAVLADRVRFESVYKSAIFIPMAISLTAASVIWGLMFFYSPPGQTQVGFLNAITTGLGGTPQGWLVNPSINNFVLIAVYIWMWTGFSMVILSAALKSVPVEILEAARVDGATEVAIFFRITIPMISPTIAVVTTTMLINVLKIFDVVYVMTGGNFHTNVVAVDFYQQYFNFSQYGVANALAVLLLIAVIPIMFFNIRRFRQQEARR